MQVLYKQDYIKKKKNDAAFPIKVPSEVVSNF